LAKLRAARSLSSVESASDSPVLRTQQDRAKAALSAVVSVNFPIATPLRKIVDRLQQDSKLRLLVDWRRLAEAGVGDATETTLAAANVSVEQALASLLDPLDLTYRVVADDTLQITSRQAAAEQLDAEFYPVADLLSAGRAPDALGGEIVRRLGAEHFAPSGGAANLHFDVASRCLILLDGQPGQRQIARLLAELRANPKPE
jgi:hypothetical protein